MNRCGITILAAATFYAAIALPVSPAAAEPPKLDLRPTVNPQAGKYVTAVGDAFHYDGQPIRFWGINLNDYFEQYWNYASIDNIVVRLRNMGINCLKQWLRA